MIILEKEKVTVNPDIKVIKRDGRMVTFDSSKIYEAILMLYDTLNFVYFDIVREAIIDFGHNTVGNSLQFSLN